MEDVIEAKDPDEDTEIEPEKLDAEDIRMEGADEDEETESDKDEDVHVPPQSQLEDANLSLSMANAEVNPYV